MSFYPEHVYHNVNARFDFDRNVAEKLCDCSAGSIDVLCIIIGKIFIVYRAEIVTNWTI